MIPGRTPQVVTAGERIGHVRVERHLGTGGMGEVFLGFDEVLERAVAVKTLGEHRRLDPAVKARFLREARILSRLDHPGICRIHDLVEGDTADFLILEYIEGRTLRELAPSLAPAEVLDVLAQVAEALAAAHAEDVVHRDLKPENVMVTPGQRAKVLDFGIARSLLGLGPPADGRPPGLAGTDGLPPELVDRLRTPLWPPTEMSRVDLVEHSGQTLLTREGALLGTVRYMSPEQARGEPVAQPADMYSLGVMLHELVTGSHPYGDARGYALLERAARARTEPPTGVDRETAALIDELENLDPRRRPSARETAERLRSILDRPQRIRRRRIRRAVAGAVAAVIVAAAGAVASSVLRARRQVAVAQRFAAEARDVTWMMRAEYLSPFHDLEPARSRVRARVEALAERMEELGPIAAGPGELALGQVDLALRDYEAAHRHLEAAWSAGVRTPEAAFARGVALAEMYRIGLKRSRSLSDPEAAERERLRLATELRAPALEMLRLGLDDATTPPAYIEGLIALIEERWDDGLAAAARLKASVPWMYEAQMLQGQIYYYMGGEVSRADRDSSREREIWIRSRDAFLEATEVARSHPTAWERLCGLETRILETRVRFSPPGTVAESEFDSARRLCQSALELEPGNAVVFMSLAGLSAVQAQVRAAAGGDYSQLFAQAGEHARRAVELDPGEPQAHLFAGWVSFNLGLRRFLAGGDPQEPNDLALQHFEAALQLLPGDPGVATYLADARWVAALHAWRTGGDPLPHVEGGLDSLEPASRNHPEDVTLRLCASNLLFVRGRCEAAMGRPAVATLELATQAYRGVLDVSTDTQDLVSLAQFETELGFVRLANGEDPAAQVAAAQAAVDRLEEMSPGLPAARIERGRALALEARAVRARGDGDGLALLERAISSFERGVEESGTFDLGDRIDLAFARLESVRWRLTDGLPAGEAFRTLHASVAELVELRSGWGEVHLAAGLMALYEGRSLASRGLDPTPSWTVAVAHLEEAAARSYDRARVLAVRAEVELARARWEIGRGGNPGEALARGLADATAALEINAASREAHRVLEALGALDGESVG